MGGKCRSRKPGPGHFSPRAASFYGNRKHFPRIGHVPPLTYAFETHTERDMNDIKNEFIIVKIRFTVARNAYLWLCYGCTKSHKKKLDKILIHH